MRPSAHAQSGRFRWSGFSSSLVKSRFFTSLSPATNGSPPKSPISYKRRQKPRRFAKGAADSGGIASARGTVAGVVVEVVGVVHLGGLVDQSCLRWRRGLVPLRRAGAIACRGEKGRGSRGVIRRMLVSDLGFAAHRRRLPWLGARRSVQGRVESRKTASVG
jgi:hypothetical protein